MTMMQDPTVALSVVVLARNEEKNIAGVLEGILENVKDPFEIIVVNDSIDQTARIVEGISAVHGNIRLVSQEGDGYTRAVGTGVRCSRGDALVVVVGDSSDDLADIEKMRGKIREGFDIVCASRYLKGGSKTGGSPCQSAFSYMACTSIRTLTGIQTCDVTNSFKMYRKRIFEQIEMKDSGYATSMQITVKSFFNGDKIIEIPTSWKNRAAGSSKFSFRRQMRHYLYWYCWAVMKSLGARIRRRSPER